MRPCIFGAYKGLITSFSVLWNNRRPVLPGMKSYAHLKQHSLDNQQVDVPGVSIFAHLKVGAPGTERSIGVTGFQVRETILT